MGNILQELIERNIQSDEVINLIENINKLNKKEGEQTHKKIKLKELEERLSNDIKLDVNEMLKTKVENEIDYLRLKIKNNENLENEKKVIEEQLTKFLEKNNFFEKVSFQEFQGLFEEIKYYLPFKKIQTVFKLKYSLLKDLNYEDYKTVLVKCVEFVDRGSPIINEISVDFVKFEVTDESKNRMDFLIWNNQIPDLIEGNFYLISSCRLKASQNSKNYFTIGKHGKCELKKIN